MHLKQIRHILRDIKVLRWKLETVGDARSGVASTRQTGSAFRVQPAALAVPLSDLECTPRDPLASGWSVRLRKPHRSLLEPTVYREALAPGSGSQPGRRKRKVKADTITGNPLLCLPFDSRETHNADIVVLQSGHTPWTASFGLSAGLPFLSCYEPYAGDCSLGVSFSGTEPSVAAPYWRCGFGDGEGQVASGGRNVWHGGGCRVLGEELSAVAVSPTTFRTSKGASSICSNPGTLPAGGTVGWNLHASVGPQSLSLAEVPIGVALDSRIASPIRVGRGDMFLQRQQVRDSEGSSKRDSESIPHNYIPVEEGDSSLSSSPERTWREQARVTGEPLTGVAGGELWRPFGVLPEEDLVGKADLDSFDDSFSDAHAQSDGRLSPSVVSPVESIAGSTGSSRGRPSRSRFSCSSPAGDSGSGEVSMLPQHATLTASAVGGDLFFYRTGSEASTLSAALSVQREVAALNMPARRSSDGHSLTHKPPGTSRSVSGGWKDTTWDMEEQEASLLAWGVKPRESGPRAVATVTYVPAQAHDKVGSAFGRVQAKRWRPGVPESYKLWEEFYRRGKEAEWATEAVGELLASGAPKRRKEREQDLCLPDPHCRALPAGDLFVRRRLLSTSVPCNKAASAVGKSLWEAAEHLATPVTSSAQQLTIEELASPRFFPRTRLRELISHERKRRAREQAPYDIDCREASGNGHRERVPRDEQDSIYCATREGLPHFGDCSDELSRGDDWDLEGEVQASDLLIPRSAEFPHNIESRLAESRAERAERGLADGGRERRGSEQGEKQADDRLGSSAWRLLAAVRKELASNSGTRSPTGLSSGTGLDSTTKTKETAKVSLQQILRGHSCVTAGRAFMDVLLLHARGLVGLEQRSPREPDILKLEGLVRSEQENLTRAGGYESSWEIPPLYVHLLDTPSHPDDASAATEAVSLLLPQEFAALVPEGSCRRSRAAGNGGCSHSTHSSPHKAHSRQRERQAVEDSCWRALWPSGPSVTSLTESSCLANSREDKGIHCQPFLDERKSVLERHELYAGAPARRGATSTAEDAVLGELRTSAADDLIVEIELEGESAGQELTGGEGPHASVTCSSLRPEKDQRQTGVDRNHLLPTGTCPAATGKIETQVASVAGCRGAPSLGEEEAGSVERESGAVVRDADVERAVEAMVAQLLHWLSKTAVVHSGDLVEWYVSHHLSPQTPSADTWQGDSGRESYHPASLSGPGRSTHSLPGLALWREKLHAAVETLVEENVLTGKVIPGETRLGVDELGDCGSSGGQGTPRQAFTLFWLTGVETPDEFAQEHAEY
ncbi:hypothetical protein CSUI_000882 [Cystoisospora suis]|uniref:Uncharacterized protein n=1 Tax=Cystoisospora suis TaxID=483139 RepID=A0A2C6LEW8_9APIC|nr:hypothetical protein CSUI_000882 [Cystoisospora suis]